MCELLRYNDKQKYVTIDCETENLSLVGKNRGWNWGMLVCQGNQILQEHDYYPFWPDLKVSADAARITRFNYEDYKRKSRPAKEVFDILDSYLYNPEYQIIIHNGCHFDVYVHNICRKELGLKTDYSYFDRLIDTNAVAKAYKLGIKLNKNDNRAEWMWRLNSIVQKGIKTNLTYLGKEFNISFDYTTTHLALADVHLNWMVWQKLKWQYEI